MFAEYDVLRSTMPISSAIEVRRWRKSSSSMAFIGALVAIRHMNGEGGDGLQVASAPALEAIRSVSSIGADAPAGLIGGTAVLQLEGLVAHLFHFPTFAARHGLVEFLPRGSSLRGIEHQLAIRLRIEVELRDGSVFCVIEQRLLPPSLPAIGSDCQKRVARERVDRYAADPTRLRIEEFDLLQRRVAQPCRWLGPSDAAVLAPEQQAEQPGIARAQIAGH